MRRLLAGLAVALVAVAAGRPAGAGDPGEILYDVARQGYRELLRDGAEARVAASWRDAAARFLRVADEAPRSGRADDALYMTGICRERAAALAAGREDRRAALGAYDRLARSYPGSNLADDALLRAGRLLEAAGDLEGARRYYRRILAETPSGDMVPVARRRLRDLGRQARAEGVRRWSSERYTRVVVDLTRIPAYRVRSLPPDPAAGRPARVFVDLTHTTLGPSCPRQAAVGDGVVRRVRVGQHDKDTVRVVLDLEAPGTYRVFPLEGPPRLVLDVFAGSPPGADVVGDILRGAAGVAPRPLRVVVDPGHGGKDPGAVGPGGLKEKDVTLAIALELARLLREQLGCEVRLTRDRDVYLSLEERTAVANAFGADLFLSIHANASPSRRARGVETYYLHRSSDRAARRLAARENQGREEDLAEMEHILTDVVLSAKVEDSRRLARAIQEALVSELSRGGAVRNLGVKRGPFYVLTGAVMPSVLVETAFITHPEEARRLADPRFRRRVAEALTAGVKRFVKGS